MGGTQGGTSFLWRPENNGKTVPVSLVSHETVVRQVGCALML